MPLFTPMFLGAFNDNVFRTALVTYVTFRATGLSDHAKTLMVSLAVGLFVLPYFLFSAMAGQLTDKYEKHILIRWIKISEIFIMIGVAIGFLTGYVLPLVGLLFLMGTHSTFFGPAKYSILPDHLKQKELLGGNGLMEAGTFLAILLGTLVGGLLMGLHHKESAHFSFLIATPIIIGATVLEVPHLLHGGAAAAFSTAAWIAGVIAGITAYISTTFLMRYFGRHDFQALDPFAYYCVAFGASSLGILLFLG